MNRSIEKQLLIEGIKEYPIDNCFVMSSEGPAYNGVIRIEQTDRVKGLYWISDDTFEGIDNFFGAKFHGAYENCPVTKRVGELKYLNEHGKPLLVHCGIYAEGRVESNTSFIHAIDVAKTYPNINVILGHMGGSVNPVIKKAISYGIPENCYLETSGITNPNIIEYAVKNIGADKILFGSDLPWCSFDSMYYNVKDADITGKQKDYILVENFRRLFL